MAQRESAPELTRIVILGHTGFVGNRLMAYLQQKFPSLDVIGLSSNDVNLTDAEATLRLRDFFDMRTAVVVCSGIKSNYGNDLETYAKNVRMVENVVRIILSHPVRRLIFLSSIAVYGVFTHNLQITETTPLSLDTYYGLAKHVCEEVLKLVFDRMPASSLVLLRTSTIYGPNEKIRAETPSGFLAAYLAGDEVTLFGDGSELREFVFVEDLVKVVAELCFMKFAGVLNVSSGVPHSYRESLEIIARILERNLRINLKPRTREKVDKVYDTSCFRRIFPTFQFTSLERGLRAITDAERIQASP